MVWISIDFIADKFEFIIFERRKSKIKVHISTRVENYP